MIWRLWTVLIVVFVVGAWLLMVPFTPPPRMISATAIGGYRDAGLMPAPGEFTLSQKVGHDVFEVPDTDARHLAEEMAAMGGMEMDMGAMGDMQMGDMQTAPEQPGDDAGMAMSGETEAGHAEDGVAPDSMTMDMGTTGDMPGAMTMDMAGGEEHAEAAGEDAHGGGGPMVGISILTQGTSAHVAMAAKSRKVDRTVEIAMGEWGYTPGRIMVEPGEVIRLVVRNDGAIPHEFMFMGMAAMNAITYRIQRADWNLVEHEAISEVAVVLPGDSFETIVEVHRPGAWMFMCMFPYHMQMGMMGVLMTEGAAMDMGGMKM